MHEMNFHSITALGRLFLVEPHDMDTSFLHRNKNVSGFNSSIDTQTCSNDSYSSRRPGGKLYIFTLFVKSMVTYRIRKDHLMCLFRGDLGSEI